MEELDFELERKNRDLFRSYQQFRRTDIKIGDRSVVLTSPEGRDDLDEIIPREFRNIAMFEELIDNAVLLNDEYGLKGKIGLNDDEIAELKRVIFHELMEQIFVDGLFHADPHGGNILIRLDKNNNIEIVFLDLGSMGRSEKPHQLAEWLCYVALNPHKKPPIPEDKFLESMFFKKIGYIMEVMDPLDDVGRVIFEKLGLGHVYPEDTTEQITAMRLASEGNWDAIRAGNLKRISRIKFIAKLLVLKTERD